MLGFHHTADKAGDRPKFNGVLNEIRVPILVGDPRIRPDRVLADRAYSSKANRAWLRKRRILATIPSPANQVGHRKRRDSKVGRPRAFDPLRYKDRQAIECGLDKLKNYRGFATCYDKFAATTRIAVINEWLKRLS